MNAPTLRIWIVLLAWMALVPAATAGTPIDQSGPARPDGMVVIKNDAGSVTVRGWDREEVAVTGTLGDEAEELEFRTQETRTYIWVVMPDRWGGRDVEGTELEVSVPRGSRVAIEGVNTPVDISEVTGRVEVQTVNGDVVLRGASESVEINTVNGDLEVEGPVSRVTAQVVGGDIRLSGVGGDVDVSSVNGDIDVSGGRFEQLDSNSVAGDILFEGTLSESGSFDFESHSGDVTLTLPDDISAEFDVSTFSGDIDNELGPAARRTSQYAPGLELRFRTGAGESRVRVTTFSGDVELRRR